MRLTTIHRAALLIIAAAVAVTALWWKCRFDPTINFLPSDHRAEWIVFPVPVQAGAHRIATLDAVFRKQFQLATVPKSARLEVRAARRLELKINGRSVDVVGNLKNWKNIATLEVLPFLQIGSNSIEARVFNDDAPPALWFRLSTDDFQLGSDSDWEASIAGSAWRGATLATMSRHPGPGNLLVGGEKTFEAATRIWPIWLAFAGISMLLLIARYQLQHAFPQGSRWQIVILIATAATAWIFLLWHNASLLPFVSGYDATDHVAYIKYIQERWRLPLPNEGYEMFQPPLYYGLSAGVLSILRLSVADGTAIIALRALTVGFGIAHAAIAAFCLRLLFPTRPGAQFVGFLLAAFLPMQLYLSHYVTNETLAAVLISASIYLGLRILKKQGASIWDYLGLGLCMGTALLTKATSLLLLPPVLGALIIKMSRERTALRRAIQKIGVMLIAFAITGGWYYVWIWRHFRTPIVGNWERALGFNWWQDPGFHTIGQYLRFGRALIDPLFSGYNSFGDGIYSTLWGDGLGGGLSDMLSRTPWNYDLMVAGYWLGLIPTALIVLGAATATYRLIRQSSAEWFLLIGFFAAIAVALTFMTLRVASYAQVKAFYGLSGLVPLGAFAAVGWEKLARAPRFLRLALASLLLIWALNSFFGVWIQDSATQHIYAGRRLIREHRIDAAISEAAQAVRKAPSNATAQCFLAAVLDEESRTLEAIDHTNSGLQLDAANGFCQIQNAINLARRNEIGQAMTIAHRLVESEPENARAYDVWFSCARQLQQPYKSIEIAREALAISPFDADLHYRLGLIAGEIGDFTIAVPQFAYALLLQPDRSEVQKKLQLALDFTARSPNAPQQLDALTSSAPDSPILLNDLAWIFATSANSAVRNGAVSVRFSERACALTKRASPKFLATLAAAYAEVGKFSEAIAVARDAATLARTNGDAITADLAENLLTRFQSNEPYRDETR
jgi:tetratricopeptide (TPR) repeat protein